MRLTQDIFEPLWLVLPMHAQHVYRNARACNQQSHPHFDGPNVERHEDQEGADDDKYDGNHKVELDRPLHVGALVTEVK